MLLLTCPQAFSITLSPNAPRILQQRNGCPSELHTQLQGHQVGYHAHPMELPCLPLGTPFIRLRMSELQAQDLPALCSQVIGEHIHPPSDPGAIRHPHAESCRLTCAVEMSDAFQARFFPRCTFRVLTRSVQIDAKHRSTASSSESKYPGRTRDLMPELA
jgi:hypothetical protein